MISLSFLGLVWLYVTTTPLWLLVKMTQLEAALMFFGTFPIASRMPHYRHVVSPLTWLFWKIPTDGTYTKSQNSKLCYAFEIDADALGIAEWAIARLQVEARHSKDAMAQKPSAKGRNTSDKKPPSAKSDDETDTLVDVGRYHCTCQNHHGDLHVSSNGAHYVTAVRSTLLWKLRYDECKNIRKQSDSGLIFELMDDSEFKVMGLALRNEVFTQMIGYSGLAWQVTG